MKQKFDKPPRSPAEQVDLLQERGLIIPDRAKAEHYITFIGYYRLAVYCRPYQLENDSGHLFQKGVCFDDVLNLYIFDRQLRLLTLDVVERIEVAFRAVLNDRMSMHYGCQWYADFVHFQRKKGKFNHLQFIDFVKKETGFGGSGSGPPYCKAYYEKYDDPVLPPSWMVSETLTIGTWSRVYFALTKPADRKAISNRFNVRYELFGSWIHSVSGLRNICAHHSLLWNTTFTIKPKTTPDYKNIDNARYYAQAVILKHLLNTISPGTHWRDQLKRHVETCPLSYHEHMGFPQEWWKLAPWE